MPMPFRSLSTSVRTLCLYTLVFALLALLESSRLIPWLERVAPEVPPAAQAATLVNTLSKVTGLATLAEAETQLIEQGLLVTAATHTVGTVEAVPMPTKPTFARVQTKSGPSGQDGTGQINQSSPKQSNTEQNDTNHTAQTATVQAANQLAEQLAQQLAEQQKQLKQQNQLKQQGAPQPDNSSKNPTPAPKIDPDLEKSKVLIVGDSMIMEGLGPVIQRTLRKRSDVLVAREGKYSTGLTRSDQLDWPAYLKTLLEKHQPQVIIVCLGANDPQDIIDKNKKRHIAGTESWQALYQARAEAFADVALSQGASLIWMGLPIMGKEVYDQRIHLLSNLQRKACEARPNCTYIDNRKTLADAKGQYTTFITDDQDRHIRLRYKDKIHVTEDGGALLTKRLIAPLEAVLKTRAATAPKAVPENQAGSQVDVIAAPDKGTTAQAATVNAPTGEPSSPAVDMPRPPALLYTNRLFSHYRDGDTQYYAFVPGQLTPDERFPVVYMLHGAGGSPEDWKKLARELLSQLANRLEIVIVIPPGSPYGWYADSPLNTKRRIESYMLRELLPHVEKNLPVLPQRAIMGFSMGGHGAMALGLRNPGLFASISSMSGVLDITRHPKQWRISDVFGPLGTNRATWEAHAPFYIVNRFSKEQRATTPPLLFTIGQNDTMMLDENRLFRKRLTRLGIKHQYRETPGKHDGVYVLQELPLHLEFHAQNLKKQRQP